MASKAKIVADLMGEVGKTAQAVRDRLDRFTGEVTIDILNQNDGRFRRLAKTYTITLNTSDVAYRLPADFKTPKQTFIQVDSDGDFLEERAIVSEAEFYRRKGDADYSGTGYGFIETRQSPTPGEYLVLDSTPTAVGYLKLFYYRRPTENDTEIIENEAAIKEGVRARDRGLWPDAIYHLQIYENMKKGIKESAGTRTTGMVLKPNPMQVRINRLMHRIGKGRGQSSTGHRR